MREVGYWSDIVKTGEEIDGLGVKFSSSCIGVVGDGRDIRFWIDRWVDNQRLCDRFPRLYHLDRRKDVSVMDRGVWITIDGCGNGIGLEVVISNNCKDRCDFKVKDLSSLIEEKILLSDGGGHEMLWNKLVPKKVNIFVWRALR
ncbi:hypothetical protein Tco_0215347 [Tanacetum coccineum]